MWMLRRRSKIIFVELNHLVELNRLPLEEQKFHQDEFNTWLQNRYKIVKNTEFNFLNQKLNRQCNNQLVFNLSCETF